VGGTGKERTGSWGAKITTVISARAALFTMVKRGKGFLRNGGEAGDEGKKNLGAGCGSTCRASKKKGLQGFSGALEGPELVTKVIADPLKRSPMLKGKGSKTGGPGEIGAEGGNVCQTLFCAKKVLAWKSVIGLKKRRP